MFAWLRPNDLIWSYVVNNYLLGKEPPAFDVLYWNQDTVRLAAGLHRDFVRIALDNPLSPAGALRVLGSAVDLGLVDIDSYVVAGASDHIIPWEQAYRSSAAARRLSALRALGQRPHPGAGEPARTREPSSLPRGRGRPRRSPSCGWTRR